MGEPTRFSIGSGVSCRDGSCGELTRVVVDPVARSLTHLVVEPIHRRGMGHLVPIDLVDSTSENIRLRCTTSEFETLEDAEETQFVPGASRQWGYGDEQMLSWPYYGLRMGGMGAEGIGTAGVSLGDAPEAVTYDRVPAGEVEVRRGQHVHATDGAIGQVRGLVIDSDDHHVTHVLLDEGHPWGHKRVAIPIKDVTGVDDGVRLNLTKDEVRDLPPIDLDHDT